MHNTPFWTFIKPEGKNKLLIQHRKDLPGRIVNGEYFSDIIVIATVVQIRNCRSCTLRQISIHLPISAIRPIRLIQLSCLWR